MLFVDKKIVVATYKEIFLIGVVFSVILIAIYPKERLEERILVERRNYDLSVLYLKNMLLHDPENEEFMMAMAKASIKKGRRDYGVRLLSLLYDSKDKALRNDAYLRSYRIEKDDYGYLKNKKEQDSHMRLMRDLFNVIYKEKFYDEKNIDIWLGESQFLEDSDGEYFYLNESLKRDPTNVKTLKSAFYLAKKLNKNYEAKEYLYRLQKHDSNNLQSWLLVEYYWYVEENRFDKAKAFLLERADKSSFWIEELAMFYLSRSEYIKSSNAYEKLLRINTNYNVKKRFFYKSISSLQAGSHVKRTVSLGKRYEEYFFHDVEVRKKLLKLYLSLGALDAAAELSKKRLQELQK